MSNAREDYNGDGNSDLVLRNGSTGVVEVALMNGSDILTYRDIAYGTDWQVQ